MAALQTKIDDDLPVLVSQLKKKQDTRVEAAFQAREQTRQVAHERRMQEIEEDYDRQSKDDERRFHAKVAETRPELSFPQQVSPGLRDVSDQFTLSEFPALVSSQTSFGPSDVLAHSTEISTADFMRTVTSAHSDLLSASGVSLQNPKPNNTGLDCFLTTRLTSATVAGVSGGAFLQTGACKDQTPSLVISPLPRETILGASTSQSKLQ